MGKVIAFPKLGHEPYVTKQQVANYFRVSLRTVDRWTQRGLPVHRFGGSRRYKLSEVEAWHDSQTGG